MLPINKNFPAFYRAMFIIIVQGYSCSYAIDAPDASTVLGAGVAIYGVVKAVSVGKDIYNYCNPDEEKKARIDAARKTNAYFEALRKLRTCLMNNAETPRNALGRPTTCEEMAIIFAAIAGQPALDEMTENFKSAYPDNI